MKHIIQGELRLKKTKRKRGLLVAGIVVAALALAVLAYSVSYDIRFGFDKSSDLMQIFDINADYGYEGDFYISENDDYQNTMNNIVWPYNNEHVINGTFDKYGHKIAYSAYLLDNPEGNVVISHGYTGYKERYGEMIYYYLHMNYQVFIMDHYGHGASEGADVAPSMVYVDDFDVYVNDMTYFITDIVSEYDKGKNVVLFGHSMGGCIATLVAETSPEIIDGLVLSAPMHEVVTGGLPEDAASLITNAAISLGMEDKFVIGFKAYDAEKNKEFKLENSSTGCEARGAYCHYIKVNYFETPKWAPSWMWLKAAMQASHAATDKENVQKITVPVLMFQAEEDTLVGSDGQYTFANNAEGLDIEFYLVKDSRHEIWNEKDEIMVPYYNKIHSFMESIFSK